MSIEMNDEDRELFARTDEVLHYIWDPIGIAGIPEARDEYGSYLLRVFRMIKDNEDSNVISKHLAEIISKNMGLKPNMKNCDKVVEILKAYKKTIEERL